MKAVEKGRGAHRRRRQEGRQGGHRRQAGAQGGSFFEPTVLTDVATDMVITKEETFGPVAPLYRFKSEDEAVRMANDTPTLTLPRSRGREGLLQRDLDAGRIWRVAEALEYGIIGINEGIISPKSPLARPPPFGGMKESGIGPS
jgi:succinate-semialdehyde dehydrogenase / glutarate-semialdehyde dehydrogenase